MPRLDGKVALIVGGGQSLGASICRRFGAEGAKVIVGDLKGKAS
ncbi:hypothetical protein CM1200mP19_1390 [bacterium]|nr:MAG: hypothetical protein CM1200mP19_1390 [bacterium]